MDFSQTIIETPRLLLRPLTRNDANVIFREYREPVTLYMNFPGPATLELMKDRLIEREEEIRNGIVLFQAVLLKSSGEFLGCFALDDPETRTPELGGWIREGAHGKGYGREACAGMKQWADDHLDYDYLIWPCADVNLSSRKVAEALGGTI